MSTVPFFSIVMPIYNSEKHLRKSVESVINQTFGDFELILVNDGSTDSSDIICNELSGEDTRIKYLCLEKNVGLSEARNCGFQKCIGEYVSFMDSDDTIELNLFQKAYDSLQINRADWVIWGLKECFYNYKDDLSYNNEITYPETFCVNENELHAHIIPLEKLSLLGYAWNKFYRSELIKNHNLKYKKTTLTEDILFNLDFAAIAKTLNVLSGSFYFYNKRIDNSLTNKFVPEYFDVHKQRVSELYDLLNKWGICDAAAKRDCANIYFRYVLSALQRNCDKRSKMKHKDRKMFVKGIFESSFTKSLIDYRDSKKVAIKALGFFVKHECTYFCLALGRAVYVVKGLSPLMFARLKRGH